MNTRRISVQTRHSVFNSKSEYTSRLLNRRGTSLIEQTLQSGIKSLELTLDVKQQQALLAYLTLLQKWNRAYNLTSITDPQKMVTHHLLDSLAIVPHLQANTVLDVGTGAGLPGIPLAIALPDKQFTLLDSNGKKTRFLAQVKHELQLENVAIVHSRVENFRTSHCFDAIISRAVGRIEQLMRQSSHLICDQGHWVCMKGVLPTEEIEEIQRVVTVKQLMIPGLDAQRHLIFVPANNDS